MFIYNVKRDGETNEQLIKRSKKCWNRSRKAKKLRGESYFKKSPTKRIIRAQAVKREEYRDENYRLHFAA